MTTTMTCNHCGQDRLYEYSTGDRSEYCWREPCRLSRASARARRDTAEPTGACVGCERVE